MTTKLCMRWLMPTPVSPAMTAGIQPPDGVIDTIQVYDYDAWTNGVEGYGNWSQWLLFWDVETGDL